MTNIDFFDKAIADCLLKRGNRPHKFVVGDNVWQDFINHHVVQMNSSSIPFTYSNFKGVTIEIDMKLSANEIEIEWTPRKGDKSTHFAHLSLISEDIVPSYIQPSIPSYGSFNHQVRMFTTQTVISDKKEESSHHNCEWMDYIGLNQRFKFCTVCDRKKDYL